jgi:phosphoribosylaminoimidazolecarboxamide formyltransferase/IMP cyclohydrolase
MPKALISVFNKQGIVEFAQELVKLGFKIYASGGTARKLKEAGVEVIEAADLVGGGAILGHRVVTLSREIHAALLARDTVEDRAELNKLGLSWIDLVCVDLYPLSDEIAKPEATLESVIEMTDIGGPTMLRSAAKGGRIVIGQPLDRDFVLKQLKEKGDLSKEERQKLAAKAEFIVAQYCLSSARFLSSGRYDGLIGEEIKYCKYGENAWQIPAALFGLKSADPLSLENFQLLAGSEPSYNNFCDLDRMLQTITHLAAVFQLNRNKAPKLAIAVKHGNVCGAAFGDQPVEVLQKMVLGDPRAIFGGLVMTNFPIGEKEAGILLSYGVSEGRRLLDGIVAPDFKTEAIAMLKRTKDKCRFLVSPTLGSLSIKSLDTANRFRYVRGGFLKQLNYIFVLDLHHPQLEKFGQLTTEQENDLIFGWAINATSNSNTITLVKDGQLIGNGVGQQDRVGAAELVIKKAIDGGHNPHGAIAISDSFFPFSDGPEKLIKAGVKVIFATTGSVKDDEVKKVITEAGVTLLRLPDAIARGFFGH